LTAIISAHKEFAQSAADLQQKEITALENKLTDI